MKTTSQIVFVVMLLHAFCCKGQILLDDLNRFEKPIKTKTGKQIKITKPRHYGSCYVNAKSGLNYRASPKGKILGSFPLNTNLGIYKRPRVFDEILDEGKYLKGEWLGVSEYKGKDTVYVFSAFLSRSFNYSDMDIRYSYSPYPGTENYEGKTFVDFSYDYDYKTAQILNYEDRGKYSIQLSSQQKEKFLSKKNISNTDTVYIFDFSTDYVYKFIVRDLPAIAYHRFRQEDFNPLDVDDRDYRFGLDLSGKYTGQGNNFIFIGKENPFQTGEIKRLIWEKTDNKNFPTKNTKVNTSALEFIYSSRNINLITHISSFEDLDFYIQTPSKRDDYGHPYYHLKVVDKRSNSIVYNRICFDEEYTVPFMPPNEKTEYAISGKVFKNKPAILHGLEGYSSGMGECPVINFMGERELPIIVNCVED